MTAKIVDATELPTYDLGSDHPFARDRQLALFDLLTRSGLLSPTDVLAVAPATRDELLLAHSEEYLRALQATSVDRPDDAALHSGLRHGLGIADNPISPGQDVAATAVAGATAACVRAVLAGDCRAAFNPAGGLHHAMYDRAAGFCLVNDLVVGIRLARRLGIERVLYVDFDVHHGDGVEAAFWRDPNVVTVSFHETPLVRYPGTGFVHDQGDGPGRGFTVNVPLAPGTGDDSFAACVDAVLPRVVGRFRPGLIVSQHGCDTHRDDPLATLECTTRSQQTAALRTRELADRHCGGRWVATGGGGYQPYTVIPRAWGMVWAALSGRPLPEPLDAGWREQWQRRSGQTMPEHWFDAPRPSRLHDEAARQNERTLHELATTHPLWR